MTVDEADLRAVLRDATDHLTGPPGLLDNVRRGGRRRVARRRTVLAAVIAVAVTTPVVGVLQFSPGSNTIEVASPLLDEPTRGDLAADEDYLRQVREAWRRRAAESDFTLRGQPHVVWAGNTPAGPAAYVAQPTADNPVVVEPAGDRLIALAAFVEPTVTGPRVMTAESVTDAGAGNSQAVLLGPERDVLLVLDPGRPVEFSPDLRYTADGKIERTFQRVKFRDGAAVLRVPPQRTKVTVALAAAPVDNPVNDPDDRIHIANASEILFPGGQDGPAPQLFDHRLPGAEQVWGGDPKPTVQKYVFKTDALAAYNDWGGVHTGDGSPRLTVYGATPDGRRLLLLTLQYDDGPSRVIALLARGDTPFTAVASGIADWTAPLPVRLRLPDGQGTLVAAEGAALSYRTGAGGWHDAGQDAALLPAAATEVRVTPASGSATTLTIPA